MQLRLKNLRVLRLGVLAATLICACNGLRGEAAPAVAAYACGPPRVALTRPHAIGVAGWLPDGQLLLTLHVPGNPAPQTLAFDPATGKLAAAIADREHPPTPHRSDPAAAQLLEAHWSPDGRMRAAIVAPGAQPGAPVAATELRLFDAVAERALVWENAPRFVTDLAWAPNSRWLAVLGVTRITEDGEERAQLFLVDATTGEAQLALEDEFGGGMWNGQLAWSADGAQLAAACPTAQAGRLCLIPVTEKAPEQPAPWRPTEEKIPQLPPPRTPESAPYTPPAEITLHVYQLTTGGARRLPLTLCEPGSAAWGCTVFCDETAFPCVRTFTLPYPYAANPITITIPIESDYLLDVVPLEMGPYYHATALVAQAAAARSYAYRNLYDGRAINNSTAFQAFIPYKFESLPPARFPDTPAAPCAAGNLNTNQRIICAAVAPGYYIAYNLAPEEVVPAFAEFSADAWMRTVDGGRPYLRGVEDPISSGCDANNYGHQRGMSQEGASRWARGNRCSYAGAGNDPWSVRWDDARQILTHYYTAVHLRDSAGARLTPDYRWAPLEIDWRSGGVAPPLLQPEETHTITFTVQNTGVFSWTGQVSLVHYGWEDEHGVPVITATTSVAITQTVVPGASARVALTLTPPAQVEPVMRYRLRFDMLLHTEGSAPVGFSLREPERPWPIHEAKVTVMLLPHKTFLPLVLRE